MRGTTRSEDRTGAIASAGAEPYVGDPDRVATLMEAIAGVTVVVWLLGSAVGEGAPDLHAGRLRMLCEKLVDTPVRGVVYEGGGSLGDEVLAGGAEVVRRAAETWNIPVEVLSVEPAECEAWTQAALRAVETLLG